MCYTARTLTAFPLSSGVHGPVWWHSGQRVRGAFGTVLRLALMSTSPFRVPACVQSQGCVAADIRTMPSLSSDQHAIFVGCQPPSGGRARDE